MNLAKWSKISQEERHQLIVQWFRNGRWEDYERLANDALEVLRREVDGISEFRLIVSGGDIIPISVAPPIAELALYVCTTLPESHRIAGLPAEMAGFRVVQANLGDRQEAYLRTWKRLFKELRGWGEETTLNWAKKWDEAIKSGLPTIWSSGPVKLALPSLIDEQTKSLVGPDLPALYNDIRNVIWRTDSGKWPPILHPDTVDDYDWEGVRRRIGELIEIYVQKAAM